MSNIKTKLLILNYSRKSYKFQYLIFNLRKNYIICNNSYDIFTYDQIMSRNLKFYIKYIHIMKKRLLPFDMESTFRLELFMNLITFIVNSMALKTYSIIRDSSFGALLCILVACDMYIIYL